MPLLDSGVSFLTGRGVRGRYCGLAERAATGSHTTLPLLICLSGQVKTLELKIVRWLVEV